MLYAAGGQFKLQNYVIRPAKEFHPRCQYRSLRGFCAKHRIAFMAYMPLGKGWLVDHPKVLEIVAAKE